MPDPATAQPKSTALPPAGDARNEELKRRTDTLAEQAETQMAGLTAINPDALKPDNDIIGRIVRGGHNQLEVSAAQPGYCYKFVRAFTRSGAADMLEVQNAQATRIRDPETGMMQPVWEIVQGDMPEARELRDVSGLRRLGDCILLRTRRDWYAAVQALEIEDNLKMRGAVTAVAEEKAHALRDRGVRLSVFNADPRSMRSGETPAASRDALHGEAVRGVALRHVDRMLRNGSIPGLPAPGSGR